MSCEQTFAEDIFRPAQMTIELYHTVEELVRRIAKSGFEGRTLTLKVKFADFTQMTRSLTQEKTLRTKDDLLPLAKRLMAQVDYSQQHPVRLLGLGVSGHHAETEGTPAPRRQWTELELEFLPW